ncbi:MAG TPA: alpha/beta hydrolase [Bacillales bacterium]|nr:alpha/beta hydrolase [Bacillales bacterium]
MKIWETERPRATIVLVHGSGEHHGRYEWLIQRFRKERFNVLIGDLPGHGEHAETPGHIATFDEYIRTVDGWLAEAGKSGLPVVLFGHSLGGLIVIRTLMETSRKPAAVLLSSPCLGLTFPPAFYLRAFAKAMNTVAPGLLVRIKRNGRNPLATRNVEQLRKDEKDPLILTKVSIRWYNELERAMTLAFEKTVDFPDVPLLVLQAGDDKIVSRDKVFEWYERLPIQIRAYKEWDGLYHELFNEPEREEVFQAALAFLEERLTALDS